MTNRQIAREIVRRWIRGREVVFHGVGEIAWIELDDEITATLDIKDREKCECGEQIRELIADRDAKDATIGHLKATIERLLGHLERSNTRLYEGTNG